jgi:hypothetical protein
MSSSGYRLGDAAAHAAPATANETPCMSALLPPIKPIPIKDRLSILFIEKSGLDVIDGAFVVVD